MIVIVDHSNNEKVTLAYHREPPRLSGSNRQQFSTDTTVGGVGPSTLLVSRPENKRTHSISIQHGTARIQNKVWDLQETVHSSTPGSYREKDKFLRFAHTTLFNTWFIPRKGQVLALCLQVEEGWVMLRRSMMSFMYGKIDERASRCTSLQLEPIALHIAAGRISKIMCLDSFLVQYILLPDIT